MKSSSLKKLTAAVASALLMTTAAHAAGLGKLTVLSALGQPLRAEIEVTSAGNDDAGGLVVKLATPEAFRAANVEFNPALLTLRFNVDQRGSRQVIRISSSQPLNEPFVDMLLDMSWSGGRLVREYTFLLDPAELRAMQPAQVAAARRRADVADAAPAAAADGERRRPAKRAQPQPADAEPAPREHAAGGTYRVRGGDSLSRIAGQLRPADVSLDAMLVALYRANPDAFLGNNMNRLKSGRVLNVPDEGAVRALGEAEAHGIVVAHANDFNAYRNKLAGQVAVGEPAHGTQASQSATGKVTAKVEERPTAVNEAQDRLRLSKQPGAGASGAASRGGAPSSEEIIAKQKELAEAQARLKELERNVSELQKLATIKSKAAADAELAALGSTAPKTATPEAAKPQDAAPVVPPVPASGAASAPSTPASTPLAKKPAPIKPTIKPPAVPEPSLFDTIMSNLPLIGGGAIVLALAGLFAVQRRKKKEAELATGPVSILNVPSEPTHSLFAQTGGQSVDTTNNSVFNSNFAPSASQLDTNEVDPVAEADVYIAYGRDAQAEEILKEALRVHPERAAVRLKLLEIYAARKDQRAFEAQATELNNLTRGQGDEWAQACALGLSIDPANPLYANSGNTTLAPLPSDMEHDMLSRDMDDAFGAAASREPMGFDQHFGDALAAGQPTQPRESAPVSLDKPAAQAAEDDNLLDFDLGGLSFEPGADAPAATPVADEHVVAAPLVDENGPATQMSGLDFDMDPFAQPTAVPAAEAVAPAPAPHAADQADDLAFDMDAFEPAAAPAAPAPAAAEDKPVDFGFDMDFAKAADAQDGQPAHAQPVAEHGVNLADLAKEFDLPELPAAEQAAQPAASAEAPMLDLDVLDFGTPASAPAAASAAHDEHALDLSEPALDAPAERPAAPNFTPRNKFAPRFDFSNLEHDPTTEILRSAEGPVSVAAQIEEAPADVATAELSPAHMEMETKLDLAMAYQEIGDKEGARELLEEVIKGGNVEQASRANALRAALA